MNNLLPAVQRLTLWLIACVLAIPLSAHLIAGFSNRPLTDDFCFTVEARDRGIFGALDYWYHGWTGTYSSTFFQSVIGLAELWRFTPIFLLLLWVPALTWLTYQLVTSLKLVPAYGIRLPLSVGVACLLLSVTLNSTLNVYQSLYWTSGAITYSLPLIVLTFNLGLFVWTVRCSGENTINTPALALMAGLAMLAGGFSPLFAVVHVALWFCLMVGSMLFLPAPYRRTAIIAALVGMTFAAIAFLILLIAPGNDVRRSRFPMSSTLWSLIVFNLSEVQKFLGRSRYWLPPLVAFALIGAWLRVWSPLPRAGRWNSWRLIALVVFLIASGAVLIYCGYFTGAYAMNFAPPPRSEIVMRYVFLMTGGAAGAVVGYLMAGLLTRKVMRALLAVASIVVLVFVIRDLSTMTNRTLRDARSMAIYAEAWDSLDRRLDNATTKQLVLFQPFRVDYASIVGVGTTRDQLQNSDCLHNYYEIDSLRILG